VHEDVKDAVWSNTIGAPALPFRDSFGHRRASRDNFTRQSRRSH